MTTSSESSGTALAVPTQLVGSSKKPGKDSRGKPVMRRIVILTSSIGRGHLSTALALRQHLDKENAEQPDGASVVYQTQVESPIDHAPGLSMLPTTYRLVTTYLPALWHTYYSARKLGILRESNSQLVRRRLRSAIERLEIRGHDTVVLTHSMYCHCLPELRETGARVVVVVTDLFGGPSEWFHHGADDSKSADAYIVPTGVMEDAAKSHGIDGDRINVSRLPTLAPQSKRSEWEAIDREALRVLIIGGSEGSGPIKAAMKGILKSKIPMTLTVACGENRYLFRRIGRRTDTLTWGYIVGLARDLNNFDVVVTKPGSITLMELFDQRVPFILFPGIPGIEAGNVQRLRDGNLPYAKNRRQARETLTSLINDDLTLTTKGQRWWTDFLAEEQELPEERVSIRDLVGIT